MTKLCTTETTIQLGILQLVTQPHWGELGGRLYLNWSRTTPKNTAMKVVPSPVGRVWGNATSPNWEGQDPLPLSQVWRGYRRRYSQEHGYRFDKQSLIWEQARLHTPEQFERWSHIVAIAHNHLVLAFPLVELVLRPWENKQRPASLQQVRRGLNKLLPELDNPASPPKPREKAKGRSLGGQDRQESTIFCDLQKAQIASNCIILTRSSVLCLEIFPFY